MCINVCILQFNPIRAIVVKGFFDACASLKGEGLVFQDTVSYNCPIPIPSLCLTCYKAWISPLTLSANVFVFNKHSNLYHLDISFVKKKKDACWLSHVKWTIVSHGGHCVPCSITFAIENCWWLMLCLIWNVLWMCKCNIMYNAKRPWAIERF